MPDEVKDRLAEAMERRGLSQSELARRLEVTPAAVSAWCAGSKRPGIDKLEAIATELGLSPSYLLFGEGADEPSRDEIAAERSAYERELTWYWRPAPQDRGREYGSAAGYAFKIDLETLARETGQNITDEKLPTEPTVEARYTVVELSGEHLAQFLRRIRFDTVRPHLEAALGSSRKASTVIEAGLEELDTGRLRLIRIEDRRANGLTGPEYEKGRYMAVVRNVLDSFKGETAGGSYGLGNATLPASSRFGLVLTNSTLSEAEEGATDDRFIGRIELPWHEIGEATWAGPGWFGVHDPENQCTRSYWANRALVRDLYLGRQSGVPGASFLIVGAYDASGATEEVEEMAERLAKGLADNFWPSMVDGPDDTPARFRALVRVERNQKQIFEQFVDPEHYQAARVGAYRRHLADDVVDSLDAPGDVVRRTVPLTVPRRTSDPAHSQAQHDTVLLVAQAEDDDELGGAVTYLRGNLMVIHSPMVGALPVGARPFHAIVLAGDAAGSEATDRHAERFLRAAEPPAHNRWGSTPEVTSSYVRGGPAAIGRFELEVKKLIREIVRQPIRHLSDGPDALKELIRIVPPRPERERRPHVKSARGAPAPDGAWVVDEVVVSLPRRDDDRGWSLIPVLRFGTESGAPIPVRWREISAISRCEVIDGRLLTRPGARTASFTGVSDPRSHPVAADRATALVDVRIQAAVALV